MKAILRLCGATAVMALGAGPASAEVRSYAFSTSGSAQVAGCVGGAAGAKAPPCDSDQALRLFYSDPEVTGSPFSDFPSYRKPALVVGVLDLPVSAFDPGTGCFSNAIGAFEYMTRRGARTFGAFAEPVIGDYCTNASGGDLTVAYSIDSSGADDPNFRDAAGSGVMTLQDSLDDLTSLDSGVFARDDTGQIAMRR